MNAGTLASFLYRHHFTSSDNWRTNNEFIRYYSVLINGVEATTSQRILEHGDEVIVHFDGPHAYKV